MHLSTTERGLLYVALAVWEAAHTWPAKSPVALDTLINKLEARQLEAFGSFLVALASGKSHDVDTWLERHAPALPE